ncbi:Lrp/AsnC family transcriptional regulator [Candidatus Thorarchaeota archaeon]|nr:MAG: Lrp/AsnC family transcriptional regulator [Candidatus Thorarchaeota archaeon]
MHQNRHVFLCIFYEAPAFFGKAYVFHLVVCQVVLPTGVHQQDLFESSIPRGNENTLSWSDMMQSITEKQRRLLWALVRNSRSDIKDIASDMGRGRNWIARSMKKLARRGVIRAYTTIVNPSLVYTERNTILLIKSNPREVNVSRALLDISGLESLDGVSGEYSLLGLFRFKRNQSFERFLNEIDRIIAASDSKSYRLVQVLTTYKSGGFVIDERDSGRPLTTSEHELLRVMRRQRPSEDSLLPLPQKDIGERMKKPVTQPAVSKAIRRLKRRGVIVGYSADVSFSHLGLPIKFFLEIKVRPGRIQQTAHLVREMEGVWDLHRTSEPYSLFATVRAPDIQRYNLFLRSIYENQDILDTRSQISLEEWFVPPHRT